VEIFCYALSASDGSEWRQRIEREAEHFLDVSAWAVPDIAGRISADGIHIAVNLNGYTKVGGATLQCCCCSPVLSCAGLCSAA
jgi:protein O-GlcNAc transferase